MARIVVGSYMVRYPLGGMLSWVLQYLVGFQRLGHDVWFVEKSGYPYACYDPTRDVMSDDCSYGTRVLDHLLGQQGLQERWCFVDQAGRYHGVSRQQIGEVFRTADLFLDMGTHGAWLEEATETGCRVLGDGEPGFTQMKMEQRQADGQALPRYDFYYTAGANLGAGRSTAPTAGKPWRTLFHPVVPQLFEVYPVPRGAAFTTIMNWQSHSRLTSRDRVFGQKDIEFSKFIDLPQRVDATLEVAVHGKKVPHDRLGAAGWRVRDAHQVTLSVDSFNEYIRQSYGEFSVCKNVFVETRSGWFSDRSAAYLASGRPVILQDTGFSEHLPCGEGLFAIETVDDARAAIDCICSDPVRHARRAREIASDCLAAELLLKRFLDEIGI